MIIHDIITAIQNIEKTIGLKKGNTDKTIFERIYNLENKNNTNCLLHPKNINQLVVPKNYNAIISKDTIFTEIIIEENGQLTLI